MSDRLTVAEAEDRLRRTLTRRAGDVPPSGGTVPVPARPAELTLVPPPASARFAPRRRLVAAAAATAACILAAAAIGIGLSRGRESTEIVPAQEPPAPDTPSTLDPTAADRAAAQQAAERARLQAAEDLRRLLADDPSNPTTADPRLLPVPVAGYVRPGQESGQEIWLYASFYPNRDISRTGSRGDAREDVTGTEAPAVLYVANWYPAIDVWLFYDDGALGIHGGMVPHDELVAMARSVHRTPGTTEFTLAPPPGWEADASWPWP